MEHAKLRILHLNNIDDEDKKFLNKFKENSKKVLEYFIELPIKNSELTIIFIDVKGVYHLAECTYNPL